MKKSILFSLFLASIFSFYFCSKSGSSNEETFLNLNLEKLSTNVEPNVEVGVDCNCLPNQAGCIADCFFTSCCVCWNPETHEGGCGCWFGLSSCKTEPLILPVEKNGPPHEEHNLKIYLDRLQKFYIFLNDKNIQLKDSEEELLNLISKKNNLKKEGQGIILELQCSEIHSFEESYKNDISNLSNESQLILLEYINKEKNKK